MGPWFEYGQEDGGKKNENIDDLYPYNEKQLKHEIKNIRKERKQRTLKLVEKAKAVIENKPPKIPVRQASPFVSSLRIPGMTQSQLQSQLGSLGTSFVASRDESSQFQQSAECLELLD